MDGEVGQKAMNRRLILAIAVMLVASVLIGAVAQSRRRSHRNVCHNNLRQIYAVIVSSALADKYRWGDTMPVSVFSQYLRPDTLRCPSGGSYILPTVGGTPACTYHGNLLKESGDMNGAPGKKAMGIPGCPGQSGNGMSGEPTAAHDGAPAKNGP